MNKKVLLLAIGLAFGAVGCTLAPKYSRPAAPVPAEWPSGDAYGAVGAAAGAPSAQDLRWREFFTDQSLQQVISLALDNNRDLRLAALNVELARSLYGIQRNELFPSLNASAGAGKQNASADLTQPGQPRTTERYDVNLGITSWELDFFGRIRSLKNRALQEYMASEQARRSSQTLLVSSVANTYLALAADRENLALAQSTLEAQSKAYELVQKRYEVGLANRLTLRQAQTPVESARRDIAHYTQLVAQDLNALNLLAGAEVPEGLLPAGLSRISPPQDISAGLGSEVLLSRPDVMQAEDMLKAAYADVGAARAALFPRISLTTALGTASNELSNLFKSGNDTWNYSGAATLPVFDPRIWSALKASNVQRKIVLTQYEKTIQSAFRDVADALALRGTVDSQVTAQQALVEALQETYRLASVRYEKGIDSYLSVLDAQRSLFAAQQGLVSLQLAKVGSNVRLYAVLGGGGDQAETAQKQ
ncbi:efflux transporter outer membrane subunit [bacterium]|nr:efflux transporter outer membrane subunit [bacterium]